MSKNKRPPPRKSSEKSSESPEGKENVLTQQLCDLAIELIERESDDTREDGAMHSMPDELQQKENDFHKIIRKCLYQKKDAVLYEALERAQYADIDAWQLLKDSIEESAATIVALRGDHMIEVNAFVIPLFVQTVGGLRLEQCFQDDAAFSALIDSFQQGQLESADAKVVLVSHAYHLNEIDSITYCDLNEMVRDAMNAMTDKKIVATPAIDRSFGLWPENLFEPDDQAIELRFLLGFALKSTTDDFYRVPDGEAAAEAYFDARAERFQQWSALAAPLVKRCLAVDHGRVELNFLYQDLFHGAKEDGIAEYYMLQMMSELNQDLDEHEAKPADTRAVIGPADVADEMVLRVNLYAVADGRLLASSDKPLGVARDLQLEVADTHDALLSIGVRELAIAMKFDTAGAPVDVRPYEETE